MEIEFKDITTAQVAKVYSGKPGCGCGCRGKYSEDSRNITRVLNIMKRRIDEVQESDGIFFIEDDTRYYWVYVK